MPDNEEPKPCVRVCATCPWRKANQENPPANLPKEWYTRKNLDRLWNGVRTGKTPNHICHALDPDAKDYGGPEKSGGVKQVCAGMTFLLIQEVNAMNAAGTLKGYQEAREKPLSKRGALVVLEQSVFGGYPTVDMKGDERIQLPFKQGKANA